MSAIPYNTTFTPLCLGTYITVSGVNNASTGYDWFSLKNGDLATFYNNMPNTTLVQKQNKAFIASLAQEARIGLLPLVKLEGYYEKVITAQNVVNSSMISILSTLNLIQQPSLSSFISTLTPGYSAPLSAINQAVSNLKSIEVQAYSVSGSTDNSSSYFMTAISSAPSLTSFVNAKTYLSTFLDPATLGFGGGKIPAINSINNNAGNAAALYNNFSIASTALNNSTLISYLEANVEMSAQNTFDLYCAQIQGYASTGTSGVFSSGTAPVGIVPGIDYEIYLTCC